MLKNSIATRNYTVNYYQTLWDVFYTLRLEKNSKIQKKIREILLEKLEKKIASFKK